MTTATRTPAPAPAAARPDRPSLLPREHGAYGQLAMPLVTGLAIAQPTAAAFAFAAAFILAFVAHEPLLVLLGQRGKRLLSEEGARAGRLLAVLGLAAVAAGALAFALAPAGARLALAFPAALAAVVSVLVWRRLEKTAAGEIAVAAAFAGCGAVVALAGGAPAGVAAACAVTWIVGFTVATIAVRAVMRRLRTKGAVDRRLPALAVNVALLALVVLAAARGLLPPAVPLALVPMAIAVVALAFVPVPPRRLKASGWAIVAASVLTLVILVAGLR